MVRVDIETIVMAAGPVPSLIVLRERSSKSDSPAPLRSLSIQTGSFEAAAISRGIDSGRAERPITHDLLLDTVDALGAKLERIEIVRAEPPVFYATIVVLADGEERKIDARPSDAIALAVRSNAPMFVEDDIMNRLGTVSTHAEDVDDEQEFEVTEAARISREEQGLDVDYMGSLSLSKTVYFETSDFYACTALIPKGSGVLSLVLVYPLDGMKTQIFHQRVWFGGMVLLAVLALVTFSWFFTGKMLRPLEENQKKQIQFIASASHELRSPLAVILSSVQAMESDWENAGRFLKTIKSEGDRMSRLIGDMLSLANADNKSWSIMKTDCELDTLLLDTYEKYQPILHGKKISLKVVLPEEPLSICKCDSARISQVLGILLDNGASYVSVGGRMEMGVKENEKYFQLYVQDNGPGISDENKEAVFRRFYRADPARKEKQHFGLGLCIAREIVTLHKGSIRILDTPGGGSTFVIRLPK